MCTVLGCRSPTPEGIMWWPSGSASLSIVGTTTATFSAILREAPPPPSALLLMGQGRNDGNKGLVIHG